VLDSDLPRTNHRQLREVLLEIANDLPGVDGVPFPIFTTDVGATPLIPEDWGGLREYDSKLSAWWTLDDSCRELHFVRRFQGLPINIGYLIVPRIRPQPRASVLKRLINRGLLCRPGAGRYFVLEFSELELRALAAWCEYRFETSAMATAYRDYQNPVTRLAEAITLNHHIGEDQRIQIAQLLLTAIAQKIGRTSFKRIVEFKLNLSLDLQAVASYEQAAFDLFPELLGYQDDVADRLAANLCLSRDLIERELVSQEDFASISGQILGRRRRGMAFRQLFDLSQDTEIGIRTMNIEDKSALYLALLGRVCRLPTGRIRGKCVFAPGNAEYLDLADDAMKAAVYAVAVSSGEIVALAGRTLLVWAGEQFDERALITRASAAASGILNVPVDISFEESISE